MTDELPISPQRLMAGGVIMSEPVNELAAALAKAQSEITGAVKDAANPFFKSKYADLASVWDAFREPMTKYGLSLVQLPSSQDKASVTVTTMLLHNSGQYIQSTLTLYPTKMDPQGMGSAITYARRYAAQAMMGICPEDDDGNAASNKAIAPDEGRAEPNVWHLAALSQYIEKGKNGQTNHVFMFETAEGPTLRCISSYLLDGWTPDFLRGHMGKDIEYLYEKKGQVLYLKGLRLPEQSAEPEPIPEGAHDPDTYSDDDQWCHGTLKAYGSKGGMSGKTPWTRHTIEIMTQDGLRKTSTFTLSALTQEPYWTPELLEEGAAEQWPVRFAYKKDGNFLNLTMLDLGS